jgi:hypothetical protein
MADKERNMVTIEQRLSNLENLVNYLSKQITDIKQYSDADMAGARNSIGDITPTTYTKTAYIGDTDVVFENVPQGNITVIAESENGYHPYYTELKRENDRVRIRYVVPFESVTTITLSIL